MKSNYTNCMQRDTYIGGGGSGYVSEEYARDRYEFEYTSGHDSIDHFYHQCAMKEVSSSFGFTHVQLYSITDDAGVVTYNKVRCVNRKPPQYDTPEYNGTKRWEYIWADVFAFMNVTIEQFRRLCEKLNIPDTSEERRIKEENKYNKIEEFLK